MDAQNPLLWPKAFFSVSSTNVTIDVGYDQDALNNKDPGSESGNPGTDGSGFGLSEIRRRLFCRGT